MTNIELQGELSIVNAEDIHKLFISAAEKNKPITIDVSKTTDIDVSIVQIIISLYHDLESKVKIELTGEFSSKVKQRLYSMGFCSSEKLSTPDILIELRKIYEGL